jgi:hypothetical protein
LPAAPTPTELGLSEELAARVRSWVAFWEAHHPDETRWDDPRNRERYLSEVAELSERLEAELGDRFEIVMLP